MKKKVVNILPSLATLSSQHIPCTSSTTRTTTEEDTCLDKVSFNLADAQNTDTTAQKNELENLPPPQEEVIEPGNIMDFITVFGGHNSGDVSDDEDTAQHLLMAQKEYYKNIFERVLVCIVLTVMLVSFALHLLLIE